YNLRVVRIKPEPISGEKTYRIIIDELPKPIDSRKASQGVNVLLRSSLPVFVVNKDAMTKLTWSIQQEQNSAYLSIN
ncbi:molecular chaperone, partial [Acinetobacter baumannii]